LADPGTAGDRPRALASSFSPSARTKPRESKWRSPRGTAAGAYRSVAPIPQRCRCGPNKMPRPTIALRPPAGGSPRSGAAPRTMPLRKRGTRRPRSTLSLRQVAFAFGKMPATAHHFEPDCSRVWQSIVWHFNALHWGCALWPARQCGVIMARFIPNIPELIRSVSGRIPLVSEALRRRHRVKRSPPAPPREC
jgi:hypothetical protein